MYNQITANKRKTWLLIGVVGALLAVLIWLVGRAYGLDIYSAALFGIVFSSVYALVSYWAGDKVALSVARAKEITKADAPELWNIVENLCIAEGLPMPRVYISDDPSPNAFATGRSPKNASICFTTGLLRILEKTELQGVAAHELSHVKNLDIRVSTIVVILVGAIALLADLFLRGSLFSGGRRDNDQGGNALFIIGLVLAIVAPIAAQLIHLAVSRQREYLADASGALLTRYPDGLARALQKIAAAGTPSPRANRATAHLYFANPFGNIANLLSTHPPVEKRVERLRSMGG